MEETIESLEKKREHLYRQLQEVGDFKRGIISVIYRKCGKSYCACSKEGHPGHGPLHLWNTTIKGKSYAKSVRGCATILWVRFSRCRPMFPKIFPAVT